MDKGTIASHLIEVNTEMFGQTAVPDVLWIDGTLISQAEHSKTTYTSGASSTKSLYLTIHKAMGR